jgi:Tfp pilus assembly protein PilO
MFRSDEVDRRSINRKSARKTREKRKTEMATLTQQVVERDHRISELEKQLAAQKAMNGQLAELVRSSGMTFGSQPAAW